MTSCDNVEAISLTFSRRKFLSGVAENCCSTTGKFGYKFCVSLWGAGGAEGKTFTEDIFYKKSIFFLQMISSSNSSGNPLKSKSSPFKSFTESVTLFTYSPEEASRKTCFSVS